MPGKKKKQESKGLTRRDFIKTVGVAGAALGAARIVPSLAKKSFAAKGRDYILVGRPNPTTGAMAPFGEATPWVDEKAIEYINKKGGIYIKEAGKKLPVRMKVVDTESSDTKAAEAASRLIVKDKIDLMIVLHGPPVVNPVAAMCERYEMPCIAGDCPVEPWLTGGPYKWTYHSFWTVDKLTDLFIDIWDINAAKTNKVVSCLFPNDADGKEWAEIFARKLPPRGYKFIDTGRFPFFQADYTAFISRFKKEKVDILTGVLIPPDWVTAWRQCHQQGYVPKVATIGKALLFPVSINAIGGELPLGLTTEIWWSPHHPFKSSLTGQTPKELCDLWSKETGKQWTAAVGAKHYAWERAYDALVRGQTLEKTRLLEAIASTDMKTAIFNDHVKYNKEHYCPTPLVGGQWMKGKEWPWDLEIISNKQNPEVPLTKNMIFPLPGATG
jgi:branched-chain amino acid transport system substrate-binding protein